MADVSIEQAVQAMVCPTCKCDHLIPLMKISIERSHVGNRLQIGWPQRDSSGEFATVCCPLCGTIATITASGQVSTSDKKFMAVSKRRAKKK